MKFLSVYFYFTLENLGLFQVGQGMIYFADAALATDVFPEAYCVKRNTGYLNMTYIMLMSHDQNPQISPGALHIE